MYVCKFFHSVLTVGGRRSCWRIRRCASPCCTTPRDCGGCRYARAAAAGRPGELALSSWRQSTFAGVDALVRAVKRTGNEAIVCTRASGLFGPLIAEYTVGWLVTLERGLLLSPAITGPESWARVRPAMDKYRTLAGRTLGILGVGEIGQEARTWQRVLVPARR